MINDNGNKQNNGQNSTNYQAHGDIHQYNQVTSEEQLTKATKAAVNSAFNEEQSNKDKHDSAFKTICRNTLANIKPLSADDFYHAFPVDFSHIMQDFDIPRTLYGRKNGLQDNILGKNADKNNRIVLTGNSGVGKSTLLMRIAIDAIAADRVVYILKNSGWSPYKLFNEINSKLTLHKNAIFIFDEHWSYDEAFNPLDLDASLELENANQGTFIFCYKSNDFHAQYTHQKLKRLKWLNFTLAGLDEPELDELVHKLDDYERSGKISVREHGLSISQRREFILKDSSRNLALCLLKFRYGTEFRQILKDDYLSIKDDTLKAAFNIICLCSHLNISLNSDTLHKGVNYFESPKLTALEYELHGFIQLDENHQVKVSHPVLQQVLYPFIFDNPQKVVHCLIKLLTGLDLITKQSVNLLHSLLNLSCDRLYPALDYQFDHVNNIHQELLSKLNKKEDSPIKSTMLALVHGSSGHARKTLSKDLVLATNSFNQSLKHKPSYYFALRQLAWIAIYNKQYDVALEFVDKISPHIAKIAHPLKWVKIACYCGIDGYREAKLLISKLLKAYPNSQQIKDEHQKFLKNYDDTLTQFDYLQRLPDDFYDQLGADIEFWQYHYKDSKDKLNKKVLYHLRANLRGKQNNQLNLEQIKNASTDKIRNNKEFVALYRANIARSMFTAWSNELQEIDDEKIDSLFKQSLKMNKDPLVFSWYGTFIKDRKKDYTQALKSYNLGITPLKNKEFSNLNNHLKFAYVMLLNNKALLLWQSKEYKKLGINSVTSLLQEAIRLVKKHNLKFHWPEDTLYRFNNRDVTN